MDGEEYKHAETTRRIIGAAYTVYNTLGTGFLEKVYENALAFELGRQGLDAEQQHPVRVTYKGQTVGDYVADLFVDGKVIVEVKAAAALQSVHQAQLLNYLKAVGNGVGLLLNFGAELEVKRMVF